MLKIYLKKSLQFYNDLRSLQMIKLTNHENRREKCLSPESSVIQLPHNGSPATNIINYNHDGIPEIVMNFHKYTTFFLTKFRN